jgi:flagellar basal body-associated protein FliL
MAFVKGTGTNSKGPAPAKETPAKSKGLGWELILIPIGIVVVGLLALTFIKGRISRNSTGSTPVGVAAIAQPAAKAVEVVDQVAVKPVVEVARKAAYYIGME